MKSTEEPLQLRQICHRRTDAIMNIDIGVGPSRARAQTFRARAELEPEFFKDFQAPAI